MSELVLAGLTVLIWVVAVGLFIAFTRFCGACRKKQCDTPEVATPTNKDKPEA
ncbi:hypothetical protein [Acidihalobacter ferrooxydans]|uniref:hypothetical protein n=1 Tax=Acidihalobacter ferrooxydans TaxID=1765967 RepID=UPI0012EB2EFF|nr:hypothetical protein [Acidihalobacter ferrooxydans]